jgi:Tfp pilus assembly protein PilN
LKQLITVYCEGNDTKVAVINKDKDKLKVRLTTSFDVVQQSMSVGEEVSNLTIESEELELEGIEKEVPLEPELDISSQNIISAAFLGINLSKSLFVPALTEPAIYYHLFEGTRQEKATRLTQEIIRDIQQTKNVIIDKDNLGYIELADKSLLSVFLSGGESSCIKMINSLARYHGRRYYKIPAVKCAEISLAYYVAKRKKFFPDDYSLIVYIGKEYSKLIFLHGRKLKHIGSTLDIGTLNLHTYDVYFSKILLEMENGGISSLDNIIVCGEDDSENIILSFYGTFPEANVTRLEFDDIDLSDLSEEQKEKISAFSVPLAVANDYFDELANIHKGINLLPKYVKEEQKVFQFAWHGYAILPLLFAAAFFITVQVLERQKEIHELDEKIEKQTLLLRQNEQILNQISNLEEKINGFDQTQAILDSASTGAGIWTKVIRDISDFFAVRKNVWLTKLTREQENFIVLEGYTLSKNVLTDFAYSLKSAELKSVLYEELREKNVYKFLITFNYKSYFNNSNSE